MVGLAGPTKTYVTNNMNCPSSDADLKSELDVQALVSLPYYCCCNKLCRMVVSTTCDTQVNLTQVTVSKTLRSYVRDLVNALILRT